MRSIAVALPIFLVLFTSCKQGNKKVTSDPSSEQTQKAAESQVRTADPAIFEAALNGYQAEIIRLLESGININMKDEDGRTALMYAAFNGHTYIMQLLLEKGASVHLRDVNGRTALMLAASGPYPVAVKLLLDNKADPNLVDGEEHFSALMFAAAEGQLEVVKILLKFKADPTLKDIDGDNALTFARNNGHKEVVDYLGSFVR